MIPRERRERLFKKSRPYIRPLEEKDMGWLWAAYKLDSFKLPQDLTQEQFTQYIAASLVGARHYLVEDENKKFQSGKGPVGMIAVMTDGFRIEPAVAIFKWATPKNILRGFVAFFQWVKSSREVGECVVKAPSKEAKLLKKMATYGVLYPKDTDIVFKVSGKKQHEKINDMVNDAGTLVVTAL